MENKKRLIDANALVKIAEKRCGVVNIKHINDCPTVDAVEAVRCKDCKYYQNGVIFTDTKFCWRLKASDGSPARYNWSDDDFCSRGERK